MCKRVATVHMERWVSARAMRAGRVRLSHSPVTFTELSRLSYARAHCSECLLPCKRLVCRPRRTTQHEAMTRRSPHCLHPSPTPFARLRDALGRMRTHSRCPKAHRSAISRRAGGWREKCGNPGFGPVVFVRCGAQPGNPNVRIIHTTSLRRIISKEGRTYPPTPATPPPGQE